MMLSCRPQLFRLAVVVAVVAAVGLSACGRKGGLDPPPGAALPKDKLAASKSPKAHGPRDKLSTAQPQHKDFFLDWLLN